MNISRSVNQRLGLVQGQQVFDVSAALQVLPAVAWPLPMGDLLFLHVDAVWSAVQQVRAMATAHALAAVEGIGSMTVALRQG